MDITVMCDLELQNQTGHEPRIRAVWMHAASRLGGHQQQEENKNMAEKGTATQTALEPTRIKIGRATGAF